MALLAAVSWRALSLSEDAVFWIFLTLYLHKRDQRRAELPAEPETLSSESASIDKEALSDLSAKSDEWANVVRNVS